MEKASFKFSFLSTRFKLVCVSVNRFRLMELVLMGILKTDLIPLAINSEQILGGAFIATPLGCT
jgi:hypothetical protein